MNEYLFIIPIAIAAIIGVMSPGPSFLFVAQTTLSKSRQHGIATSLGLGTGAVIFTLLACFGLFVVLETAPYLYSTLKFIGGMYLFYLAYRIWQASNEANEQKDISIEADGELSNGSPLNQTIAKTRFKEYLKSCV